MNVLDSHDLLEHLQILPLAKVYSDIRKNKSITFHIKEDGKLDAQFLFHTIPYVEGRLLLQDCATRGMAHTVELFVASTIAGDGPRIYEASQMDCEAMEQMHLKLPLENYHQPFPTMIIKFPEKYSQNKIVPNATVSDLFKELEHQPRYVAVHFDFDSKALLFCVHLSSGQVISRIFWTQNPNETLEDAFVQQGIFKDSLTMSEQEWLMATDAMRVGANCCYLLHHYGCEKIGPKNPSHFQRLLRYVDVAKKSKDRIRIEKAEMAVQVTPQYYRFRERERKLYHSEGHSDRSVRTHWRQGHIARQRHGPKWSLTKIIVRLPTLVNP